MNSKEIRRKFLQFFEEKGHTLIPGASLIPENDPTTLFVGSGMQPLVPYLLGEKHPFGKRLANCQKSFRAADIESVGDNRHTTFFEMLGNWSLGDYFKKEQLNWIFDFLTGALNIDPGRLYVTVFRGNKEIGIEKDSQSAEIWKEIFSRKGIEAQDLDFSEKKGMENGRIFYFDETKNWWSRSGLPRDMPLDEPGGPDSEIFYDLGEDLKRHENSVWKDKPCHVNCDCGRFIEIGNSVFMEYIKTEKGFEKLPQKNVDFGGGLERISMVVQGKTNVFETDLFIGILNKIKELSGGKEYQDNVKVFEIIADHVKGAVFVISEDVLPSNTERGYILRRLLRRAVRYGKMLKMPGDFLLPLGRQVIEIYQDIYPEVKAKEEEILTVIQKEKEKFEETLQKGLKQFEKIAEKGSISGVDAFHLYDTYGFPLELTIELAREKRLEVDESEFKKAFKKHQEISRAGAAKKFGGGGEFSPKLHTATHLLHAALRKVLGEHIRQMGSDITAQRLRFDFSHHQKLTAEQIKEVENIVNRKIKENLEVKKEEMSLEEALTAGALAFFREKYPEKVSVYTVFNPETGEVFSKEICGGPHVKKTSELGEFKIKKEESSSAGVRRIRAVLE